MTRNLCDHPELHNFKILLFLLYGYNSLYNSKILLFLHYFLTPQFQTFTKIFHLFLFEIGRNFVSIIVNVISNNTVLQCYLLWIFVSIRRLLQLIVCIGVSTPVTSKTSSFPFFFFAKPPFKSGNYSSPFFRQFTAPVSPPKNVFFHAPSPPSPKFRFLSVLQ